LGRANITQIFFGVVTVIGVLFVFFLVPETKGRSLEEMDELFGEVGFATADKELKEKIERDIGLTALLNGEDSSEVRSSEEEKTVKDGSF
jgi:hypothetical protein